MEKVTIEIDRLRVFARHGVMEQERVIGNEFEISLSVEIRGDEAVRSDSLESTINYAEMCAVVKDVMAQPSALLEHVCGRLRDALMLRFPQIESGRVRVAKLHPPIPNVQLNSVAVSLSW